MKPLCIIPARGGSKRLPRKNILEVAGEPMIGHVIRNAQKSEIFHDIIVSSEDDEILNLAKKYGASQHFRPSDLSQDTATVVEVILEVLQHHSCETFCCIYATAPMLKPTTIERSYDEFRMNNSSDVLMGVSEYNFHPAKALEISNDGRVERSFSDLQQVQSQMYPEVRVSNGTFYWANVSTFMKEKSFYSANLFTYDVNADEVSDVDTYADFIQLKKSFS